MNLLATENLRRGAALMAILAALSTAAAARAWQPIAGSRPVWCGPAPYAMNNAGSADLGAASSESEVRRGMDDWTRVSCSALRTTWRGTTASRPGSYEGVSAVGWIESGWRHDGNAIGVTGPRWGGSCIVEADMELNGVNYTWTTEPGRGNRVNAYSIILHEGGHYYGLGHSSDPGATMYFAYSGGVSHLNADDERGICALYPGSAGSDCATTGCPAGYDCGAGGECEPATGDGSICSPCTDGSQCGGPNDFCIRYPDGAGYCARNCTGPGQCGTDLCADLGGVGQCLRLDAGGSPSCEAVMAGCRNDSDCVPSERCRRATGECVPRPTDRAPIGAPCDGNEACNSETCLITADGGVCTESCDWLDPLTCPEGFYCNGNATGCGSGVCLAGNAGTAALGEACEGDTDCATLLCSLGLCATPCIPGGTTGCPESYTCQVGSIEGCGACRMARQLGESCDTNEDCVTRICAVDGDRTFCTELCRPEEGCVEGFSCEPAGAELHVCAPPPGTGDGGTGGGGRGGGCGCRIAGTTVSPHAASAHLGWIALALLGGLRKRRPAP